MYSARISDHLSPRAYVPRHASMRHKHKRARIGRLRAWRRAERRSPVIRGRQLTQHEESNRDPARAAAYRTQPLSSVSREKKKREMKESWVREEEEEEEERGLFQRITEI